MMNNYLKLSRGLITLLALACFNWAYAQQSVSGRITDSSDDSGLPGVNVVEKGTTNGTITDFDGNYTLQVGQDATLVVSFVGYVTQELVVGNQSVMNVAMPLDVQALEEIVVIGYGTQDKKEITSAVVSLDAEDFNQGNINDPAQLLQGKVPGLSVYNRGGDPNTAPVMRLRGISTVGANTEPLVVIDGVIGASFDNVDPNDIESIIVLKDGSASAIYGSRGSSGVILVTTKRGSRGKITAEYNVSVAASKILKKQPVMTAQQYKDAGGNDLGDETVWYDEVTRTGVSQVHNIAVSGGAENTTFRLSTNFRDQNGILNESGFDQINARANINHFAIDDRLQIAFNMSLTNRESNFSFNEALRYATLFNPTA
ncbi:MAG: TonB-dependent receptor plug domain-containing protein, partial [Bacteroidetes bacterium]|nr:TonB-dependent receptor plug domain-containing protein [Bacteroidota bacterium]